MPSSSLIFNAPLLLDVVVIIEFWATVSPLVDVDDQD